LPVPAVTVSSVPSAVFSSPKTTLNGPDAVFFLPVRIAPQLV
jgi:hypothetical protein